MKTLLIILSLTMAFEIKAIANDDHVVMEQAKAVHELGIRLNEIPSEELAKEFLVKCYATKTYDKNIFCLERYLSFHQKYKLTSEKIIKSEFSKVEQKFIHERFQVLLDEKQFGNDPSSK